MNQQFQDKQAAILATFAKLTESSRLAHAEQESDVRVSACKQVSVAGSVPSSIRFVYRGSIGTAPPPSGRDSGPVPITDGINPRLEFGRSPDEAPASGRADPTSFYPAATANVAATTVHVVAAAGNVGAHFAAPAPGRLCRCQCCSCVL